MAPRRKSKRITAPQFLDEDRQPWDRQTKESDAAWRAFQCYRDLPHLPQDENPQHRTQREVSARLYPGKSPTQQRVKEIGGWSTKWSWVERANAYDTHLDQVKQEEFRAAIRRDTEVNIATLRAMRSKGGTAIATVLPSRVKIADAVRMVDVAITGLRREAGLATEIQGTERDNAFVGWLTSGDDDEEGQDGADGLQPGDTAREGEPAAAEPRPGGREAAR